MLTKLKQLQPKEEEEKELIALFETIFESGYDDYKALVNENPDSIGLKTMKFFMLPKTELHNQIRKFISRIIAEQSRGEEERVSRKMEYNKQDASRDKKIDDPNCSYSILSDKTYGDKHDTFNVLTIGIEYTILEKRERETKYSRTMNIFSNKTPNLYLSLKKKLSYS